MLYFFLHLPGVNINMILYPVYNFYISEKHKL